MAVGFVYLVGAGPGDPGCLTLRGRECLERADVVIYDYLANATLLDYAPRSSERIFAGKHGAGPHLLEQGEINSLMIRRANAGETVVRLKGGDPLVFGRGGEEVEALAEMGIPFEVVPGVSAALAAPAFAGIPVTHRDWVSGVTVLTGHEASDKGVSRVDWQRVANAGNTLVLLMGYTQLRQNIARLIAEGLSPSTPAAAIQWASRFDQRVVEATVGTVAERVVGEGLGPPMTVVIGEVVRLREAMAWFESRPLFGRRVLVTRAAAQAPAFARRLEEKGAGVVSCPAIEIRPLAPSMPQLERAFAALGDYDWLIFTSTNGVEIFFDQLFSAGYDLRALHRVRLAAIGSETSRALRDLHLHADVVPEDFRAEGLLEAMAGEDLRGARVLLPRARGARAILPDTLRDRGARVEEIHTYESVAPAGSADLLRAAFAAGVPDCITFTSSSTVTSFLELLDRAGGEELRAHLAESRIACIGPITEATARESGLSVDIVPEHYTIPALVEAIVYALGSEDS